MTIQKPDIPAPGLSLDIERSAPAPAYAYDPDPYLFGAPAMNSQAFNPIAGQTVFVLRPPPMVLYSDQLFINGVKMTRGIDYTIVGPQITLSSNVPALTSTDNIDLSWQ